MKVKCHQISRTGVVREHNEDFIAFWEPEDFSLRQSIGSISILADGVGGEGHGEIASRLAAETALAKGIKTVVFDRGGARYHRSTKKGKDGKPVTVLGKLATLAEAARAAGLKF